VIIQDSNGFPGSQGGAETARQKVLVGESDLKVLDSIRGWALYVRLGKKTVTEAFAGEKGYVEKPLSSFAEMRDKREKTRAEKVAEYKHAVSKAKDDSERANLKRSFEAMGLREDGRTVARFESFPGDTKKITLLVNNEKKEVEITHHKVRENEGKEVFDIWAAPSIAAPVSIFKFYKEIGTFSPEVVQELTSKLEGFPIEITAVLDDGNNQKTLHSKVVEIRQEEVAPGEYDVPAGFKPRTDAPAETAPASKPGVKQLCAVCSKEVAGEGSSFTDPWSHKRYPVCSDEHRSELIKKLAAGQRQKASSNERPK
jgi:hypothetical protein